MLIEKLGAQKVQIDAPAKINLFLEVTGRRPDGYHDLETIMHSVDLYDRICIDRADRGVELTCSGIPCGSIEGNLAYRAADLFFQSVATGAGASIHLKKNIPVGAGLGGGSSDAAGVLIGLNVLFGLPLSRSRLIALGAQLGSDIPFFFFCGTALCRGRGEIVEPLSSSNTYSFFLIYPGFPSSTRKVYQNLKLDLIKSKKDCMYFVTILRHGNIKEFYLNFFNRLQRTAFEVTPRLEIFWRALEEAGLGRFTLSGSGSSFFRAINDSERELNFPDSIRGEYPMKIIIVRSSAPIRL